MPCHLLGGQVAARHAIYLPDELYTMLNVANIKRSLPSPTPLPLYCERFMMIYYSLLLSVFDGLQEAARHVCQRMESMATSRMMRADSGRMYHGKEMA